MQWLVKQERNYRLNPSLQFCSDHANPPHSFLHTMVVTASAQMRVDVYRWKTWGDTREMADEWGGIEVNRQMKTSISRNTDGEYGAGMDMEQHIYKPTRACTWTDCFYIIKSCTHANITNIPSAQQWQTASSVGLTVQGLLRGVVRGQTCISTCLWCA